MQFVSTNLKGILMKLSHLKPLCLHVFCLQDKWEGLAIAWIIIREAILLPRLPKHYKIPEEN